MWWVISGPYFEGPVKLHFKAVSLHSHTFPSIFSGFIIKTCFRASDPAIVSCFSAVTIVYSILQIVTYK